VQRGDAVFLGQIGLADGRHNARARLVASQSDRSGRIQSRQRPERWEYVNVDDPGPRQNVAARQNVARAADPNGRHGQSGPNGYRERPCMKLPYTRMREKRTFRKEGKGLAGVGGPDEAARVHGARMAVEAIDEFGADAAQQQTGDRHARDFFLDHEAEAGRKGGFQYEAIQVARP
jgi:hypothetical protein